MSLAIFLFSSLLFFLNVLTTEIVYFLHWCSVSVNYAVNHPKCSDLKQPPLVQLKTLEVSGQEWAWSGSFTHP